MEDSVFLAYASIVDREFGIQLPREKKALLESRLQRLFHEGEETAKYHDAAGFLKALKQDGTGKLLKALAEAITTHHTFFMREADHFWFYRDTVLPWLASSVQDGDIRTWCAACSTGQEAYTLAMLLQDQFGLQGSRWEKTLLATDLSTEVLETAKAGVYEKESLMGMPENWLRGYFHAAGSGKMQVNDGIRQQVLFRPFNLMTPSFPFKKPFHVIFCRNVMIYFDAPVRNRLVRQFYDYLEPGGYLFVGHSETVERQAAPFQYVMPSVYRKPLDAAPVERKQNLAGIYQRTQAATEGMKHNLLRARRAAGSDEAVETPKSVKLIALGASTGGTEALASLIRGLRPPLPPIVIVQHIPYGFSRLFAERLNNESDFTAAEASDGEQLQPNHIYVAPGDRQMRVRRMGSAFFVSCRGTEQVSGHCPSVDVLFDSVAEAAGAEALGVILTGMGSDGAEGLLMMRQKGARTLGQDEATSVVYGMPRAAFERGAVMRQLPLAAMSGCIMSLAHQQVLAGKDESDGQ